MGWPASRRFCCFRSKRLPRATADNDYVCDPSAVNGFDRGAIGNNSGSWQSVSDLLVPAAIVMSLASVAGAEDMRPFLNDAVVGVETVMISTALGAVITTGVGRPRPWAYDPQIPEEERLSGKNSLSFYSGHTATAAAATTYAFYTLHKRGVHPAYSWGTLALGTGITSLVGAGRVLAGKHFATDVIAGALVGSSLGLLIPALHESNFTVIPEVSSERAFISVVFPTAL